MKFKESTRENKKPGFFAKSQDTRQKTEGLEQPQLIKNIHPRQKKRDFSLNAIGIGFLGIGILFVLGGGYITGSLPSLMELGILLGIPCATLVLLIFFPRWSAGLKICILLICILGITNFPQLALALIFAAMAVFITPAVQRLEEWERAIVLRFGRFHRTRGPGLFMLLPLTDRIAQTVDLRIRVTDFSTQETLTLDSVTVTVDALCFWLVWDPEKAVLEVQNYEDAVILSSKTALRNAVSSHDLTTFLGHGEVIQKQIQEEVDRKTTEWGITIQHIEITDIQIPEELQDSLSRIAQAEREKKGRILLADAEIEIAKKLEAAVDIYAKNEPAMKLKILSILNEGLKAGNSMMLVPNSITENLEAKDIFGLEALTELRREKSEK
ncbi:MAG: slipin family protein [Spirochaetaceae bacterium]|jgi:regulator of protease activity HflC (stomatin/prohibitin superfamily)|nr:slipin family protein [Spirochaetaceae bacterium]